MISRLHVFRALTVGWMILIFFLSSQPSLPTPALFPGADLLAHAVFYAVLGVFLARSLIPQRVMTWKRIMLLTVLVAAYGITDEYHQLFVPGRDASGRDILADGLGGFLAAWMLFWRDRRVAEILRYHSLSRQNGHARSSPSPLEGRGEG
ncbi:MAG: VanZ family protein [Sulfuricaulis sp.]